MARHRKKKKSPDLVIQVMEEVKAGDSEAVTAALRAVIQLPQLQAILFAVALKTPSVKTPGVMVTLEDGGVEYRVTLQFKPASVSASTPPIVG